MATELTTLQQSIVGGKATMGMLEVDSAISTIALPELTGSEKQVAWASLIRRAELEVVVEEMLSYQRNANRRGVSVDEAVNQVITEFVGNAEAVYWIDGRNGGRRGRVAQAIEAIEDAVVAALGL